MFTSCTPPSRLYTVYSDISRRLKKIESWRGKTHPHCGFSKEDKEALNALIFVILIPIFKKENNINCDVIRFVIYFFKRLCSKAYLWDSKPSNKRYLEEHISDYEERKEMYVRSRLSEKLGKDFVDWVFTESNKLDADTIKCFNVAKTIATLIEYEEIESEMRSDQRKITRQTIFKDLAAYYQEFPFIEDIILGTGETYGSLMQLLENISWARYTFRWQGYDCPVGVSILTHMLESAILGYFMFVENNLDELKIYTKDDNPKLYDGLEKAFTVLLFHDIAEIWTDDINSPAKDGMGIREVTEAQELEALNTYFYSKTPDFVDKYFMDGVMLEDIDDQELKSFFKSADYFSADLEIWWNIRGGSREARFKEILQNSYNSPYRTPIARETLKNYLEVIADIDFFD